jgi:hypothetical protein
MQSDRFVQMYFYPVRLPTTKWPVKNGCLKHGLHIDKGLWRASLQNVDGSLGMCDAAPLRCPIVMGFIATYMGNRTGGIQLGSVFVTVTLPMAGCASWKLEIWG